MPARPDPTRRTVRRHALVAVAVAFLTLGPALGGARSTAWADESTPTMSISPGRAEPGQDITVTLADWPPGLVTVEQCGDEPQRGEPDCDRTGRRQVDIGPDGSGGTALTVGASVRCPCTVQATASQGRPVQALPLEVLGADSGVAPPPTVPEGPAADDVAEPGASTTATWLVIALVTLPVLVVLGVAATRAWPRRRGRAGRPTASPAAAGRSDEPGVTDG